MPKKSIESIFYLQITQNRIYRMHGPNRFSNNQLFIWMGQRMEAKSI